MSEKKDEQDTGEHSGPGSVIEPTRFILGDDLPVCQHRPNRTLANICVLSDQQVRTLIREEVHRTLYPAAEMANPHVHRRIEMTEEDGKRWRGLLYLVEKEDAQE